MNPLAYLKLARDIAIGLALAFIVWRIYTDGRNSVKASDLKALQSAIAQQQRTIQTWQDTTTHANDQLSKDLAAIRDGAALPKLPVWVLDAPAIPAGKVLPASAAAPSPQLSTAGGSVEGPRRDIRPQLEQFKQRYETELALCRAEHAEWPQP